MTTQTLTRPSAPRHVDADNFRWALSRHPAGVVIVTADVGAGPVGLTATSFVSVSLTPPMVGFCVAATSRTWPHLSQADSIVVHILGEDQHELASRFARRDIDRFAHPTRWSRLESGEPLLSDAPTWLRVSLQRPITLGDHFFVLGSVLETGGDRTIEPLIYQGRSYHCMRPHEA